MNVDSVLHGEIDIQVLDYTSQVLKVQYECDYGLLSPSYLYSCVRSNVTNVSAKIPRNVKAIQMHYIPGHYVLSSQNKDKIIVFDSLPSDDHKRDVFQQLQLLYDNFHENNVEYTTAQHQGSSVLCGLYVIANAVFILNDKDPHCQNLVPEKMRTHLHKCLIDGKMSIFPTTEFSPLLTSYFKDQQTRLYNHKDTLLRHNQCANFNKKTLKRQDPDYRAKENELRREKRANYEYRICENEKRRQSRSLKRRNNEYRKNENLKRKWSRNELRNDINTKIKENRKRTESRSLKRKDTHYTLKENRKRTESRRSRRDDENYRLNENKKRTESRSLKRKDKHYTLKENRKRTESRRSRRDDENYRLEENKKRTESRSLKRKDKHYTLMENRKGTESRRSRRDEENCRLNENKKRTESRSLKRKDKDYKLKENRKRTESRRSRRDDENYRLNENKKRAESRSLKRKDKHYTLKENRKRTESRRSRRDDENYRLNENKKRADSRSLKRKDKHYTLKENRKRTESSRSRRDDENYRLNENKKRTESRSLKRKDKDYTLKENRKRTESRHSRRNDENYRLNENNKRTKTRSVKRQEPVFKESDKLIENFHNIVKSGPVITCCLCKQLWYKHSVLKTKTIFKGSTLHEIINHVIQQNAPSFVLNCTSNASCTWICNTCATYIKKRKVPPCSYLNKMTLPDQGPLKQLNVLEQLLIAPILPFFRLQQATVGKQYRINGNVVLVPSDVQNTVSVLPRLTSETATIKATLKRKLQYKHYQYSMNIRPEKIRESIAHLKSSTLYRDLNIELNENFDFDNMMDSNSDLSDNEDNTDANDQSQPLNKTDNKDEVHSDWSENENQIDSNISPGIQDTMLSAPDFVEPSEKDFIFNFAPGEGRQPVCFYSQMLRN